MIFWCFCITVLTVYWVEHGLAIRKNVKPPEGVAFSGGSLGREADCKNKANVTCDNIWWLENSQVFVSQGPQASVTFNFSGDQIYVYGTPSVNGAIAVFTLDDKLPERVDTGNLSQSGSDSTVLWSSQALGAGNHTLGVNYDPKSREGGVVRYLFLNYFSYNEPSEVFSLPVSPSSPTPSSTPPAPIIKPSDNGKFTPEDRGVTWNQYIAPAPTLGVVLSTAVVLLLLGTTTFLCKHRRKRWQDTLAPDPFIDRDSFSNSMMNHIHPSPVQESTDLSQLPPNTEPIQVHRDFPPPPRPPPTVTSIDYGDQIAETLSTMSWNEQESSIYVPTSYRLRIPGSSYRRPSDTAPYHT